MRLFKAAYWTYRTEWRTGETCKNRFQERSRARADWHGQELAGQVRHLQSASARDWHQPSGPHKDIFTRDTARSLIRLSAELELQLSNGIRYEYAT